MPDPLEYQRPESQLEPRFSWLPRILFVGIVLLLTAMFISGPLGD